MRRSAAVLVAAAYLVFHYSDAVFTGCFGFVEQAFGLVVVRRTGGQADADGNSFHAAGQIAFGAIARTASRIRWATDGLI